jgi:hypothetical protein
LIGGRLIVRVDVSETSLDHSMILVLLPPPRVQRARESNLLRFGDREASLALARVRDAQTRDALSVFALLNERRAQNRVLFAPRVFLAKLRLQRRVSRLESRDVILRGSQIAAQFEKPRLRVA